MKSYGSETQSNSKNDNVIVEAQMLIKYLIVCAHTEQVPFADHRTAEVLRQLEAMSGIETPSPR